MRLRTIGLVITLALGLSAAPLPVVAQEATKIPRIGYLSPELSLSIECRPLGRPNRQPLGPDRSEYKVQLKPGGVERLPRLLLIKPDGACNQILPRLIAAVYTRAAVCFAAIN